ncbi:DUF916 domain-containing protein [Cellulosimicrobium terreum]|nr:DUF916 domain-containing protein [Cellulosimicrobium terreum]
MIALAALAAGLLPAVSASAVPVDATVSAQLPRDTDDSDVPAGTITWSVAPADEDGPDGRRAVELDLDPGDSVDDHVAVTNFGDVAATFALTAADGYRNAKGRFNMLPADQESVDAGTWIEIQDSVEVGPEETVVVPYTLTVPDNATPGDHQAGIAASVTSTGADEGGTSLGVTSRVGFRVSTRVSGELDPELAITGARATYSPSWNPFAPGEVRVSYAIANEGNVRLGADSVVEVAGPFGIGTQDVTPEPVTEVLPGGSIVRTEVVDDVWPLVRSTSTITVTPVVVGEDEVATPLEPVTTTVTTWTIPWPQLLIIAIVVMLVLGIRDDRRRRRKKLDAMLAKARDEGRQQASGAGTSTD